MTETGMSPADFAALNGNNCNDGMFGSGAWWIIVLFLFMWGRNGWGNGNGDSSGAANGCKAIYRVTFNGNIAIATDGTVEPITVALQEDGETVNNAVATVTPAAIGDFFNVSLDTFITIPCGCCVTVSVKNISDTTAIDIRNANIIFSRVA